MQNFGFPSNSSLPMQLYFDCPKCLQSSREEVTSASREVRCNHCSWVRPIDEQDMKGAALANCVVCGCGDLWRQKDFDQRLGVVIVGLGIVMSTVAIAYMMPGVAMIILMAFGLADWILYAILPDRMVCYRCHARYRQVPDLAAVEAFDLEVNERYRQEAIRLNRSADSAARE